VLGAATLLAASLVTPADCGRCHVTHFQDWTRSAHAQATQSALYRTLELLHRAERVRAGQTDDGQCAGCHGAGDDGVDCESCHAVVEVQQAAGTQGLARMRRGPTGTFFGPIEKPADARAHRSSGSAIHRDERICAPCHDHDAAGAPCCTVLREWRGSEMADFATCQSCHMRAVGSQKAARDGPTRSIHRHHFPGSGDLDQLRSGWGVELREASLRGASVQAVVAVTNRAAHSLPNGEPFGARVLLRADAVDEAGRVLASDERSYGFEMLDDSGAPTVLQSRAVRRGKSTALAVGETRQERIGLAAEGAREIIVTMWHVPFETPAGARGWIDELRGWIAKEKPDWHDRIERLGPLVEARARPRLFARVSRSLESAAGDE